MSRVLATRIGGSDTNTRWITCPRCGLRRTKNQSKARAGRLHCRDCWDYFQHGGT